LLKLERLKVTQNAVRNTGQLGQMVEFASRGGTFTYDALLSYAVCNRVDVSPKIHIAFIKDDGSLLVHDGHHRVVAIHRAGRHILHTREYDFHEYSYDDYLNANPDKGWYTPFDPRTECRLADFGDFKDSVRRLYYLNMPTLAALSISRHAAGYKEPRRISTISELSEVVG
jgi:hypothetical protein